jgi:penicillin-binding protein 2
MTHELARTDMNPRWKALVVLLLLGLLTACQALPSGQEQPLPTLAQIETATPVPVATYSLDDALRTAMLFLDFWVAGDYPAMYERIAFASQEATPFDAFQTLYTNTAASMTLVGLQYTAITLYPNSDRNDIATFNYAVTFETERLGQFDDPDRRMQLVVDPHTGDWRVAWTPGDIFAEMSNGGQLRLDLSPPLRANIFDRDDLLLADMNGRVVVVRAVKNEIVDWPLCLSLLAPALARDPAVLQGIYDESSADWLMDLGTMESAAYEQAGSQLEQVCAADFSSRVTRRYMFNGAVEGRPLANVLGSIGYPDEADLERLAAVGFDSDSIIGKSGVERFWDVTLRGQPGANLQIVSPGGEVLRQLARSPSQPAQSVWLTLDSALQAETLRIIENAYQSGTIRETSRGASAVIMDVRTGEILALVSYPTYDANVLLPFPPMGRRAADAVIQQLQSDPRRPLLNRPTQGLYPLGSVMKIATSVAILNEGVYALDTRYTCSGVWNRDIVRVDWLAGGHGTQNTQDALTHSCNPFYYEAGFMLNQYNPYTLPTYARDLGLGVLTGIQDIEEEQGLIIDPDWKQRVLNFPWNFSDAVNMSIGQGEVQVTPLQVVRMVAAIANGGQMLRPELVWKAGLLGEAPSFVNTPEVESVVEIRPEVLEAVRAGMCNVTQRQDGTAEYQFRDSELQSIGICGKTGTATDGSSPSAISHAWFAAYAPMREPEIAIVVMVENSGEGSGVAAPLVRDILEYYFLGIRK